MQLVTGLFPRWGSTWTQVLPGAGGAHADAHQRKFCPCEAEAAAGAVSASNGYVAFVLTHWNAVRIYCHPRIIVTIVSKARVVSHNTSQNYAQPLLTVKPKNTSVKYGTAAHTQKATSDQYETICCFPPVVMCHPH